jgi:hypothetical protein
MKYHPFLITLCFSFVIIFFPVRVNGQSISETLSNLSSEAATKYVEPGITTFGANMTGGWFSGAPSPTLFGLHIQARFVAVGSFFSNEQRQFSSEGTFRYNAEQVEGLLAEAGIYPTRNPEYEQLLNELTSQEWVIMFDGPTILGGSNNHLHIEFPGYEYEGATIGAFEQTIPEVNGFLGDLSFLPNPAIQLNVGTIAGTNLSARYFPEMTFEDLGKTYLWGIGLLHNPGLWFENPLPIDLSVGIYYQKMKVGDVFKNDAYSLGLYLSKKLGNIIYFEPYSGLTYENSETNVHYTFEYDTPVGPVNANIDMDLKGENVVSFILGGNLNLAVISFNFNYKFAEISTMSAGIGFGF